MESKEYDYISIKPDGLLVPYVENIMMSANNSFEDREIVLFPDGRIDVMFICREGQPMQVMLFNMDKKARKYIFTGRTKLYIVCLTLPGTEYLLRERLSDFTDDEKPLSEGFGDITEDDLCDFETFRKKAEKHLITLIPEKADERKLELFRLIYETKGSIPVQQLAQTIHWSSRQINRYFNQQFGFSLKKFCTILRFRSTFKQVHNGKLYPEGNFADQAHFIREIKKFSGFIPSELSRNKNDRFIQFLALSKE